MEFYLGTHVPVHLKRTEVPLFLSRRVLEKRKSPVKSIAPWALDSGGFSELKLNGAWKIMPDEYVETVNRLNETPNLRWAAQQDWMCEPFMVRRSGLTVREHQRRTVANFLELRKLDCDVPIIPVLQGYTIEEYKECFEMFEIAGVDLRSEPLVGLGSVCRRQNTNDIERIVSYFHAKDLKLHGFGVKIQGLNRYGEMLESSDSMAWSQNARWLKEHCSICKSNPVKPSCNNCLNYALEWRSKIV